MGRKGLRFRALGRIITLLLAIESEPRSSEQCWVWLAQLRLLINQRSDQEDIHSFGRLCIFEAMTVFRVQGTHLDHSVFPVASSDLFNLAVSVSSVFWRHASDNVTQNIKTLLEKAREKKDGSEILDMQGPVHELISSFAQLYELRCRLCEIDPSSLNSIREKTGAEIYWDLPELYTAMASFGQALVEIAEFVEAKQSLMNAQTLHQAVWDLSDAWHKLSDYVDLAFDSIFPDVFKVLDDRWMECCELAKLPRSAVDRIETIPSLFTVRIGVPTEQAFIPKALLSRFLTVAMENLETAAFSGWTREQIAEDARTYVEMDLDKDPDLVCVRVVDNGRKHQQEPVRGTGQGLSNLRSYGREVRGRSGKTSRTRWRNSGRTEDDTKVISAGQQEVTLMNLFSKSEKPVVVWVDHEKDFLQRTINCMGALRHSLTTMARLSETCDLVEVVVKPVDSPEKLENLVIAKIQERCLNGPDLVLVDLSFGHHELSKAVDTGRELASRLRQYFCPIPVGVYTRHPLSPLFRALISTDAFAVVLEKVSEMYEGGVRLATDEWYNLFTKIITAARDAQAIPLPVERASRDGAVTWAPGHPLHRSRSFSAAAIQLVSKALAWLDPAPSQIILTQLSGGFSGAFVVKADPVNGKKSFVIKIDENLEEIRKELEGYRRVASALKHECYLPLAISDIMRPVTLRDDWWGCFAMDYEGEAKPLIEHSQLDSDVLASIYTRLWNDCLRDLYGAISKHTSEVVDIISQDAKNKASEGLKYLRRYVNRVSDLDNSHSAAIEKSLSFLEEGSDEPVLPGGSVNVPWAQRIHGDLNCRNVLYDIEKNSFSLIDFPHVGSADCLAVDFVKAEAELVLIMMDWGTGHDYDFERLACWGNLTGTTVSNLDAIPNGSEDPEINRVLAGIRSIREAYSSIANDVGGPRRAYQLYLLARVLQYVGYPDLTIAKRFLALLWAGQLLEHLAK